MWYPSGDKLEEKHFKNGKEHGRRTEWKASGEITFEGDFEDGVQK